MNFLTAKQQGVFIYHEHSYKIEPVTFPGVNIRNILATSWLLAKVICEKNPDTMQEIFFDAEKIPGYPKRLETHPSNIPAGSKLMLLRGGGIGDIIMFVPALKKLKQIVGNRVEIIVSTFQD
ncbi:hypothetical protein EG829_32730, partial [bacterium]|nr:hypothetical protein [bacterium]